MTDAFGRHSGSADGSSLPDESRIRELLEEILESGSSPEQVSGGDRLLERVLENGSAEHAMSKHSWMRVSYARHRRRFAAACALDGLRKNERLPEIPGYEIHSIIGTGGMGIVYRARHLRLGRWVAIKMVLLGAYASREEMECLLREAQDVAALQHPNIVQVYDVAEHDGFPYYAMELLDGGDLARSEASHAQQRCCELDPSTGERGPRLASRRHAPRPETREHTSSSDGTPKIGDFSLVRRLEHESAIMTQARPRDSELHGAEQAAGVISAILPAVDIYALGAILYELLTGRPPFKAESSAETRRQVITEEPVPPHD